MLKLPLNRSTIISVERPAAIDIASATAGYTCNEDFAGLASRCGDTMSVLPRLQIGRARVVAAR
jgi:hypothetical protein